VQSQKELRKYSGICQKTKLFLAKDKAPAPTETTTEEADRFKYFGPFLAFLFEQVLKFILNNKLVQNF
jgi:hypothetical protein